MDIFVGNLSFGANEGDVKKLFEGFGNVASVAIVMRKEKKAPKSRGFGFVQMPDEQQALAAIAALNDKEFMGRALNVDPARPNPERIGLPTPLKEGPNPERAGLPAPIKERSKAEAYRESKLKKKAQPEATVEAEQYPLEEREEKKTWFSPVFNKHTARVRPFGQPGTYKGGRRTRSYMKRRGLDGIQEEAKPRQKSQDNPMRWRKKKFQVKPRQKSPGGHKPWSKSSKRP